MTPEADAAPSPDDRSSAAEDPDAVDPGVVRQALNDLMARQGTPIVLAANPIVASLLALPLWTTPALLPLSVMIVALSLANLLSHLVYQRYRRNPGPPDHAATWRNRFFSVSLANSLAWGFGGLWVFVSAPEPERFLVAAVVLGMAAGTLGAESASFRQVAGFVLLALPPIGIYGLVQGSPVGLTYGLGVGLFIAFMLLFARVNHDTHVETIRLRFAHRATLTTLHRTVDTLQAAQAHIEQADRMASLGRLVAGMAHEINTPLGNAVTAVSLVENRARAALEALDNGTLGRAELARTLTHCAEAGMLAHGNLARTAELVGGFKNVAVDRASARRRAVNVAEYLAEVLISLRPRIRKTPHTVSLTCDPDLTLDSYPGALSQVVTNLLLNALTHAFPADGPPGIVTVTARPDGSDHLRIVVADDGRGIDPSVRETLFEPFVTTNRAGGGSGLGMGIALTQTTHVLGGSLRVESTPGHGTRVTLRLPRVAPEHGPNPTAPPMRPQVDARPAVALSETPA